MARRVLQTILILVVASKVAAYPSGAPVLVCDSMAPGHLFEAQTKSCPFVTQPDKVVIDTNSSLNLTLKANDSQEFFKGFLLIALDEITNKPVGSFAFSKLLTVGKTKSCSGSVQDMATHHDANPKTSVAVTWTPPVDYEGTVIFMTTYVQDFSTYWVKQPSVPVKVSRAIANTVPVLDVNVTVVSASNVTNSTLTAAGSATSSNATSSAGSAFVHVNSAVSNDSKSRSRTTTITTSRPFTVTVVTKRPSSRPTSPGSFDIQSLFRSFVSWLFS